MLCRPSIVAVMQATNFGSCDDFARRATDRPALGRILAQAEVSAAPMVIGDVRANNPAKMSVVEDDHMVQTFAADRSDQSLDVWTLPRTHRTRDKFGDSEARDTTTKGGVVDAVAVG